MWVCGRVFVLQVDELLKRRLGDEDALIGELAKTYSAEEDPLLADLVSTHLTFRNFHQPSAV